MKKSTSSSSPVFLFGVVLSVAGFAIYAVGLSMPNWRVQTFGNVNVFESLWWNCEVSGVFTLCQNSHHKSKTLSDDLLLATRVFAAVGLGFGGFSLLLQVLIGCGLRHKGMFIANFVVCFTTAAFILVSVGIYQTDSDGLSWGWGLCFAAMLLYNTAGAVFITMMLKSSETAEKEKEEKSYPLEEKTQL